MNRIITLIFLFIISKIFCQEDLKKQVFENFKQIASVDPQKTDYSDLENIGKAIRTSKIVFLGEQDHGDGPTFLAKTRLVKYLHEKMGFEVLVFEGDFWGLNSVWDNRLSDTFSIDQIRKNTYNIWARCQQTQELYGYIEQCLKTNNPLIVSGTDCRHSSVYTKTNYSKALRYFVKTQSSLTSDTASLNAFLMLADEIILKEYKIKTSKEKRLSFIQYLDKVTPTITDTFWKQEFIDLKGGAQNSWVNNPNSSIRDEYMAKNLLWLYNEKYYGKKIIVWAHSAHNAKNIGKIKHENNSSMGNEVFKSLKDSIFVLGFSSLTGRTGRVFEKSFNVDKATKNSFESWVSTLNYDYGFINFRSINNNNPFYMKGLGHNSEKTDWTKVFDGIFYIKTMYPCDSTPK